MRRRSTFSSVLAFMLCLSLIVGATYALLTSDSETNIAITSGKVEVLATIDESKITTYSPTSINMDGTIEDKTNAASGLIFKNGGSVAYDAATATLALTNITPGDKVDFSIDVTNNSNVTIQYRVVVSDVEGGSLNGLVFNINNTEYTGEAINSEWKFVGAQGAINSIPVSIELPATSEDDDMTTKLSITVEAVQGNTNTNTTTPPPVVEVPGTLEELQQAFADAANQATGDIVIELTQDFDVENSWTAIAPSGYNGANNVVVNGNGHTIFNLNETLFVGSFGGYGSLTINDLTIENANISGEGYNGMGLGAFVAYSDASGKVVLNNCHLVNSTVICTGEYAGGLVGYSSSDIAITNSSVTGSTITSGKSAGAIIGQDAHAGTMDNITVTGCKITSTGIDEGKKYCGTVVGTSNAAASVYTNVTTSGNTIDGEASETYYGRAYVGLSINGTEYVNVVE